jgi:hypothetical protein
VRATETVLREVNSEEEG